MVLEFLRPPVNWKAKVAIQAVLAHIPGGEAVNYRLQWANGRYTAERLKRRTLDQAAKLRQLLPHVREGVIVDVGTGWELIAPILFHLMGANQVYTYDHLRHLRFEIPNIVISQLGASELSASLGLDSALLDSRIERLKQCHTLDDLLTAANITYCAPADACNTGLPSGSVDLFFTYEVLEHMPESVLNGLVVESKRVLKPSGIAYHAIEPGDHYTRDTSHINHYRYPEWLWSLLIKNNISYHNRLCQRQFRECFERHGAIIQSTHDQVSKDDLANLRNGFRLDKRFKAFSPDELAIWYAEFIYGFSTEFQS
ncbi:MAG TPA: methyltransferase domain-containing protein [Candidatus Angelobacter sp.]|jgi:hypothetical protein|nr:methyltransferase domain-containing protein [Candidatus Angelobacter sp.]